jgi:branched-subunit amino acid transport protein
VSGDLVLLAVLMGAVTYPSRALPLLAPGIERLPARALLYLRLVGPAVLASIAIVNTFVVVAPDGSTTFHVGIELVGVLACLVVVARWRNLFAGLVTAVAIVAVTRAVGLGG